MGGCARILPISNPKAGCRFLEVYRRKSGTQLYCDQVRFIAVWGSLAMISASDILNAAILIVDDLQANVRLLENTLRGAGYTRVASTMNPHEVCALHRENHYDLILLDVQMPGLDGFQVMEGLKTIEANGYLPVLAVTAQPPHKLRALHDSV